ncbi:MAG: NADH-quinone oxidoreductase subunit L, partial [Verrucomicrobia bacterium]|nr:NADH-quinone oxidoreductase subunit L [Verrucomicrobiota bacterium]
MSVVLGLILIPLVVGGLLCFLRSEALRTVLVVTAVVVVGALGLALAMRPAPLNPAGLPFNAHTVSQGMLVVSVAISLFLLYVGIRARNALVVLLALAQGGLMLWFESGPGAHVAGEQHLFVDNFGVIMALINGLVGGGICL